MKYPESRDISSYFCLRLLSAIVSAGVFLGLALGDSVAGANGCAAAAADASVGIDLVDIALRDSLYGAYGLASAACYAVVTDYVSHSCKNFISL